MAKAALHDLEALKRYLGREAPFLGAQAGRETGVEVLDRLLARPSGPASGLPRGALTLLRGPPGSGRASLAARILARETAAGRPVAWVDARGTLHPPALAQAGVDLERLLVVRPEAERAVYAAERVLESGAFEIVAMSGLDRQLGPSRARRLQSAAEAEAATGLVLLDASSEAQTAGARLTAASLELRLARRGPGLLVSVERDRLGPSGRRTFIPLDDAGTGRFAA